MNTLIAFSAAYLPPIVVGIAYVSIRQHTSAYASIPADLPPIVVDISLEIQQQEYALVSRAGTRHAHTLGQNKNKYIYITNICTPPRIERVEPICTTISPCDTSAYVSTRQHTSAHRQLSEWNRSARLYLLVVTAARSTNLLVLAGPIN